MISTISFLFVLFLMVVAFTASGVVALLALVGIFAILFIPPLMFCIIPVLVVYFIFKAFK